MKIAAFQINAFSKAKQGGNPAGVVLNADGLSEDQMKGIARRLGLSQTAFIMKSNVADFKIRFFTPSEQVDLCGHATIGSFAAMLYNGNIKHGNFTQQTKAGILNVKVMQNETIMMNQTKPNYYQVLDYEEIADSLNISVEQLNKQLPIQVVSTGLRDIMVPIKKMQVLKSIKPDFNKVSKISKKYNVIGYHIFSLETLLNLNAHCRNLAPLYGIPQESATGTSNGALACYLHKYNQISNEQAKLLTFQQGYTMNMPSEIIVSLNLENNDICEVKVGGRALFISENSIEVQQK